MVVDVVLRLNFNLSSKLNVLCISLLMLIFYSVSALADMAAADSTKASAIKNTDVHGQPLDSAYLTQFSFNDSQPQKPTFQVYEDRQSEHNFDSIRQLSSDHWQAITSDNASFGFTESPFWIRTRVLNDSDTVKNFILEVDYPLLDSVAFQAFKSDGSVIRLTTGDTHSFYPRHVDQPGNLIRFQLFPQEHIPVYIRVQTEGSLLLPMLVWEEQSFYESAAVEQKVHFYYYGAMSVIILINIAVFFTLRERLYLYYAIAITGYLVFFSTSRGYIHQIFLPDAPDLNSRLFLASMPILALFSVLFARQFLKTADYSPKLDLVLKGMVLFECFNLTLALFFDYDTVVRVSAIGAVLLFTSLFIAGPITFLKRKRTGLYFMIAWTPLTIGFFATSGRTSGFLPNNFLTEYAMQIGSGLEAIILTLALADRLYREREKKIKAQEESLNVEKQRSMTQSLLTEAMSRDPVTRLSNRNRFEWLVKNTIQADPNKMHILALAKVTRVDEITKTLGLSRVEGILKYVGKRLNDQLVALPGMVLYTNDKNEREGVFQLSRETFGAFMELQPFEDDPESFYQVLKRTAEPIEVEGITIELSPIYGSAMYPKHGSEPARLIRNAHIALQESRHSKEMMGIFHERLDIYDENRLYLVTQLREALEQDALQLYYQPKMDIQTGKVVGMEGLARWIHPSRGFIPPDEFILLAEEAGLIHRLTLWAFERAIKDFAELAQRGYCGSVSVNISARDLQVKNLTASFKTILDTYNMPAESVYLELTETGAMEDPKQGIATLNELADIGLNIAIDDFGTGYSSLSYLQRLPATEIKLDRSLIHDICHCESTAIIAKTSIDMVHALGYKLVAEGVEDEQTVNKLSEYSCDSIQGYWYCKPKPFNEIQQWLAAT